MAPDVWEEFYPAGVWACDTEFTALPGERQVPICVVARDLNSGRTIRQFEGQFSTKAPFPIGNDALFVAFVAAAECGTFRALGWGMPQRILDLSVEPDEISRATPSIFLGQASGCVV
jgi:hypothetical protein